MTHEQLIAKAREHAAAFERGDPFVARVGDFERVTVREAAVVRFDSSRHGGYIQVFLDRASGDFISAECAPLSETDKKAEA